MKMKVEPEDAGSQVDCPSCGTALTVPSLDGDTASKREGWKETDPTNPNMWVALGIGSGIFAVLYGFALLLKAVFGNPNGNAANYIYSLLWERTWVNFAESFLFTWGVAFLILKYFKYRHQHAALHLDVMPEELGREVNKDNIGVFIDHVYSLPVKLRDSLMVNRIRKALELFESRRTNSEVSTLLTNQSGIDGSRIGGSYTLVKVFVWAIPILGFVGTVLGLSEAIGLFKNVMSPEAIKDPEILMKSMGGVTGGLGTAFDTTLLALIYSLILSLPMSSLQKIEDDNLTQIDAYCNETLLPRLDDGPSSDEASVEAAQLAEAMAKVREQIALLDGALQPAAQQMSALAAGAQEAAIHLPELQRQSQEAQVTAIEALHQNLGQLQEKLGQAVVQAFQPAAQQLQSVGEHLAGISRKLESAGLGQLQEKIGQAMGQAFQPAVQQLQNVGEQVTAISRKLESAGLGQLQEKLGQAMGQALQPAVQQLQSVGEHVAGISRKLESAGNLGQVMGQAFQPAAQQLQSVGEHVAAISRRLESAGPRQDPLPALQAALQPALQHANRLTEGFAAIFQQLQDLSRVNQERHAASQRIYEGMIVLSQQLNEIQRTAQENHASTVGQNGGAGTEETLRATHAHLAALAQSIQSLNQLLAENKGRLGSEPMMPAPAFGSTMAPPPSMPSFGSPMTPPPSAPGFFGRQPNRS